MAGVPSNLHPGKRPSCAHRGECPLEDACAACRTKIHVHDRSWLLLATTEGLVAAGNFCSRDCETWAQHFPNDVAEELRWRKLSMSGAEV